MYKKGYHHTEEEKEKIRASKLGAKNPMYGKIFSEETRAKMSKSRTGKPHPIPQEARLRQAESLREFYATTEGKKLKKRLSELIKGNSMHVGYRHTFSDEFKVKRSAFLKKVWGQSEEYKNKRVKNILRGSSIKPNKPELAILDILNEVVPEEWKYVGDGKLIIAGKNPDFVNVNGKKQIIEVYGEYWHNGHNPEDRVNLFAEYGYSTLVIWESELKDTDKVIEKIKMFCNKVH